MSPANAPSQPPQVSPLADTDITLDAVVELLRSVYQGGGYTPPEVAERVFRPDAVAARGDILVAPEAEALLGVVILVRPSSTARRLAADDEAELHLLGVAPRARGRGVGAALVEACMQRGAALGYARMILWTQPVMRAAQRLYQRVGFVRAPTRDHEHHGRRFLVYEAPLPPVVPASTTVSDSMESVAGVPSGRVPQSAARSVFLAPESCELAQNDPDEDCLRPEGSPDNSGSTAI